MRSYTYERLDGNVRGNERQSAIDRFSKKGSGRFVFLLSTRAGGLGVNLTAADTVIIYDSDWNPQNDIQAQARCHRIGQTQAVKVYRRITRNTYEMEMFRKASLKLGLDHAVLGGMAGPSSGEPGGGGRADKLSAKEIDSLLKHGAYHVFQDDDAGGEAAARFSEADIDSILERSTHVKQQSMAEAGSTFSKATFVSSGAGGDVNVDDDNFWEKIGLKPHEVGLV
ncbi:P-loop containing nucleoside triphosphate hydrolase protein [Pavlovales sp. CCMP2436]|nr:P-loop containing nucleoside triphosphate hydrolase protein [Pavlovales sp. CCMP2436]